jgi:hypothetical protein
MTHTGKGRITAALAGALALVAAASVAGCGGTPSCEDAIGHIYAEGCALTSSGNIVSEGDAVSGCLSVQAQISAGTCPCSSAYDAVLDCINGIGQNQCSDCSSQWTAFDACVSSCGS